VYILTFNNKFYLWYFIRKQNVLVEQEPRTISRGLIHPRFLVRFVLLNRLSSVQCFQFVIVCSLVLFLLGILLSVLYGFTASDCPFGIFKLFLKKGYLYVYVLSLVFYAIKKRNVVTLVCRDIMWITWNLNISIALQHIHFSFTNFWPFVIQSFSNTSRGSAGFWIDFQISQNIHMLNEFKLKPIYAIWWNICFMQWQPSWMVFRAVKHNFERGQPKMNLLLVTMAIWNGERRCW
jgi:hypothetical protein